MAQYQDPTYLQDYLTGPILKIEDPNLYSVEDIIKSYYREIIMIANKYTRPTVEKADLIQEGIAGLIDAIKRFDMEKSKGNPRNFHNLAIVRITDAMYNLYLLNSSSYTLPGYMARGITHLNQVRKLVEGQNYDGDIEEVIKNLESPEFEAQVPKDVSAKLRERKDKIARLAESINSDYPTLVAKMLKAQLSMEEYERTGEEDYNTPENIAASREYLQDFLSSLKGDPREIMELSLQGLTLEEIGVKKGLTRQRIQQIRQEALEYLQRTRMFQSST